MTVLYLALGVMAVLQGVKEGVPWTIGPGVKLFLAALFSVLAVVILGPSRLRWQAEAAESLGVFGGAILLNQIRRVLSSVGDWCRVQVLGGQPGVRSRRQRL